MSSAVSLCILSVALFWLARTLHIALFSGLSEIPNAHSTTPFSNIWLLWAKFNSRENRARLLAHEKYGPIIRIGPRHLSINCIEGGVKTVHGKALDKDIWYKHAFRGEGAPYMFTTLRSREHAEQKRMFSNVYSKSYLQNSLRLDEIHKVILLDRLRTQLTSWADSGMIVEAMDRTKACLMDLMSAWIFGLSQGTNFLQDNKEAQEFFDPFRGTFGGFFWRSEFPGLAKIMRYSIFHLVPEEVESNRVKIQEWSAAKCKAVYTKTKDSSLPVDSVDNPLVYNQLRSSLEQSGTHPSKFETILSSELLDHMVAGHDATAITVEYVLYELSQHRPLQKRLRREIKEALAGGNRLSLKQTDSLSVLDAIMMETLRVYSANPGPWSRITRSTMQLGNFERIPSGTVISASSYAFHRNKDVFPNPDRWQPERWLGANDGERKEMSRWLWAFGSGPRMCLGSSLAVCNMKAMIMTIYADFETVLVDGSGMEQLDAVIASPVGNRLLLKFYRSQEVTEVSQQI